MGTMFSRIIVSRWVRGPGTLLRGDCLTLICLRQITPGAMKRVFSQSVQLTNQTWPKAVTFGMEPRWQQPQGMHTLSAVYSSSKHWSNKASPSSQQKQKELVQRRAGSFCCPFRQSFGTALLIRSVLGIAEDRLKVYTCNCRIRQFCGGIVEVRRRGF